ncbi:hypothetical protein B9Z55_005666 [Caenorhabditis nigoni]|uniref:Uncharacterized protein n=1 Tax=Caenorhabditis nigoni TaxID=1611254 RepID=A0A2G5V1W6_9PELO|nr:hypothetical protein B9Z55_005666 [Caenorhabditis nigoni]
MFLSKAPLGTPSTPIRSALPNTFGTCSTPQRANRVMSRLQIDVNPFVTTSPIEATVSAPFRTTVLQRAPFRHLRSLSKSNDTPSPKRAHNASSYDKNGIIEKRFHGETMQSLSTNESIWNLNHRNSQIKQNFIACSSQFQKENGSKPILQESNMFKVFYETEPMDCEVNNDEIAFRNFMNDSMEIDIDDDTCKMEVDSIADVESLMDYIPMH